MYAISELFFCHQSAWRCEATSPAITLFNNIFLEALDERDYVALF
jgi:hypothetical protein